MPLADADLLSLIRRPTRDPALPRRKLPEQLPQLLHAPGHAAATWLPCAARSGPGLERALPREVGPTLGPPIGHPPQTARRCVLDTSL